MNIPYRFATATDDPYDCVEYEARRCVIRNPDGSAVFEMEDVEVPAGWSQLASDILISKYLRKAGVPGKDGRETSARQVVGRVARTIRAAGEEQGGFFDTPEDAEAFERELTVLILEQRAAFNSPIWFNCGLSREYGIRSSGGNWVWNAETDAIEEVDDNYRRPQCSACFIQSIGDDLMSIFQLVKDEARIFKFGSGTGTNFSTLRGRQEHLSGGGTSSGLMSFLEVFDRAAGATKSGGTTRRAAKMVCLDADHPEIRDFVNWKRHEEAKARALVAQGYSADFNGEAYHTVSGQNGNNSVRLTDEFLQAWRDGSQWHTYTRTTGELCETFPARDLMRDICESAWECADPGLQFHTTINDWHTCPESGPIRASNPCSEFMFLDDSACNLASINLMKYLADDGSFDIEGFRHTVRLLVIAQEIIVDLASYPTEHIARNSHDYRPLGLGFANLGALLMVSGLPYDSDGGRALAAAVTALMCGQAYAVSSEIARDRQPFAGYRRNAEPMLRVIRKHRAAVEHIDPDAAPGEIVDAAREAWDRALQLGEAHGYRNAQVTVLAPTGTIGLLMDCDTTGVEPDFALVKFKKLAGGGFFKIVNQSVRRALAHLGYDDGQVGDILRYVLGTQTFEDAPHINRESLRNRGLEPGEIDRAEESLPGVFDLEQALSVWTVGADAAERIGIPAEVREAPDFSLPRTLGFSADEIEEASRVICGAQTIEGAPHLDPSHYAVFDCANRNGPDGERYIEPIGHVRMMAAVQPFISGAISKTINLPNEASVQDIEDIYIASWEMGLKAVALYRDGCKSSQPLNASRKKTSESEAEKAEPEATLIAVGPPGEARVVSLPLEEGQLELFPELADYGLKRRPLPKRRRGITVEARVAGHKVFLRTGEYEDGNLGEIFIDMHKEGSSFRSMMMCFAIAVSKGLQYGVPLKEFVDTFTFTNFEPRGVCDHPNIRMVTSVIDYVFRVLGMEYLGRTDFVQVKPEDLKTQGVGEGEEQALLARLKAGGPARGAAANDEDGKQIRKPRRPRPSAVAGGAGAQMQEFMGDAPLCDICGHLTVRNGACYKCLNCGNSIGCS